MFQLSGFYCIWFVPGSGMNIMAGELYRRAGWDPDTASGQVLGSYGVQSL